jgi:hypothetical protein
MSVVTYKGAGTVVIIARLVTSVQLYRCKNQSATKSSCPCQVHFCWPHAELHRSDPHQSLGIAVSLIYSGVVWVKIDLISEGAWEEAREKRIERSIPLTINKYFHGNLTYQNVLEIRPVIIYLFYYYKFFIRIYSLYGGIHCDNSEKTYVVHYLHCPCSLSPSTSSPPYLKQLQEVF